MNCYDPRDGQHKETENPALILADLSLRMGYPNETFWQRVSEMADYCEEPVEPQQGFG